MRALEKFDLFSGSSKTLRSWLYTVTRNIFIDEIRKVKNKDNTIDYNIDEIAGGDNNEINADDKMIFDELLDCIKDLVPPVYAEILMLRFKQELETNEIASVIGKSEENVRTILHRALTKLRDEYNKRLREKINK